MTAPAVKSIREWLAASREEGLPAAEAEWLLGHCLRQSRAGLYARPEREVPTPAARVYRALTEARLRGEPIAYLLGEREFWSIPLGVGPGALIPRPETETLVEWALELPLPPDATVADLGTGTGAIAIALATERPRWRVLALENSPSALALAERNIRRQGCGNIDLRPSDWYSGLGGECLHAVISNPPYIPEGDPHLTQGDLRFEPLCALRGGKDGLDAIRRIIAEAPRHLRPSGWLLLEHGFNQAPSVRDLLTAKGFTHITTRRDLAGHERVSGGSLG